MDIELAEEISGDAMRYFYHSNKDDDNLINKLYKNRLTDNRKKDEEVYLLCSEILYNGQEDDVTKDYLVENLMKIEL